MSRVVSLLATALVSLLSLIHSADALDIGVAMSGTDCPACATEIDACSPDVICNYLNVKMVNYTFLFSEPTCDADLLATQGQALCGYFASLNTSQPPYSDPPWSGYDLDCATNGFNAFLGCAADDTNVDVCFPPFAAFPATTTGNADNPCELQSYQSCATNCAAQQIACQASTACFDAFDGIYECQRGCQFNQSVFDSVGSVASDYYACLSTQGCLDDTFNWPDTSDKCCDCADAFGACFGVQSCVDVFTTVNFKASDNIFDDLYQYCQANVAGCAALFPLIECISSDECTADQCADDTAPQYDEFDCAIGPLIWQCVAVDACFIPFNATIFGKIEECDADEEFCSLSVMSAYKVAYCALPANDCTNALFNTLFDMFEAEIGSGCLYTNCIDEIELCTSEQCLAEAYELSKIEDKYNIDDDDLFVEIKEWFCGNQPGGACTDELEDIFTCQQSSGCVELAVDTCVEEECRSEIDDCFNSPLCSTPLLTLLEESKSCDLFMINAAFAAEDGELRECCGDTCDALNATAILAGTSETDFVFNSACTEKCDETRFDACVAFCDECGEAVFEDHVLPDCKDGQCGDEWVDLFTCLFTNCPDTEPGEDECVACAGPLALCIFSGDGCYDDFMYLETVFNDTDEEGDEDDGFDFNWKYPAFTGEKCSEATFNQTVYDFVNESGLNWTAVENEITPEAAAFIEDLIESLLNCIYDDLRGYCDDQTYHPPPKRPGECSDHFWNSINCLFEDCLNMTIVNRVTVSVPPGQQKAGALSNYPWPLGLAVVTSVLMAMVVMAAF